jgi:hypothetical protein
MHQSQNTVLGITVLAALFFETPLYETYSLGSLDGTNHKLWAIQSTSSSYKTTHSKVFVSTRQQKQSQLLNQCASKEKRDKKCKIYSQSFFNATTDQHSFALMPTYFSTKRFNLPSTRQYKDGVPCRPNLNPNTVVGCIIYHTVGQLQTPLLCLSNTLDV